MILNKSQAEAIAKALSELNNIGGRFSGTIVLPNDMAVMCWSEGDFTVTVRHGESEYYADQTALFTAYGLN